MNILDKWDLANYSEYDTVTTAEFYEEEYPNFVIYKYTLKQIQKQDLLNNIVELSEPFDSTKTIICSIKEVRPASILEELIYFLRRSNNV